MARRLSHTLAKITEEFELNATSLVTNTQISELCKKHKIKSSPENIIYLLKNNGWLMSTGQSGVWEFIPAAVAGNYGKQDPLMPIRALSLKNTSEDFMLCLQTAAWAQGLTTRIPSVLQACTKERFTKKYPESVCLFTYNPVSNSVLVKNGVRSLSAESNIALISKKPSVISNWNSAIEWIDEFAYELELSKMIKELEPLNRSTRIRCGYLLQGMRPDISEKIFKICKPTSKIHFGPRRKSLRNDEKWLISDSILPFDPKELYESR